MKRILLSLLALWCMLPALADNPLADERAVVTSGNARFTVLTPQLVRMEWSADGRFEDRATLTFVNRRTPVPDFKVRDTKTRLTITTPALKLTYLKGERFSDANLRVEFLLNGRKAVWTPGMEDPENLMGTSRTLDGADGARLKDPMEPGLVSRSGWAVVDDSRRHLLAADDSAWGEWVEARPAGERQDLYLFAHGHDYKQALSDYALVAGRAPMPPRYTLGYWWSRYWQYSDNEFRDLVAKLKSVDIPIDVLIVDMDWHETWGLRRKDSPKDEYDQRIGWTGYTWQKELFPSPANFLEWTETEQLKVALNLHPASGIQPYEAVYDDFVSAYGWQEKGKSVPFAIDDRKWADAYFDTVLGPMERDGVDFWWLDWQQWKESKFTPGLSNTFWLNHTFFRHAERQHPAQRPFIYHRWGGLGSHRYPLAFSGDTYATWATLAYLPYFTATASNVNYGYWGHDIGGHMFHREQQHTDPELYTRWLQYGVFTPIFKTHSTKDPRIERYPWLFPDHLFLMRDAIRLRYTLAPYIYNAVRENYDTGIGMCRPMYYDWPEEEQAYNAPEQFLFGDDLLATAVTEPVDRTTGLARRTVWFPEGQWYDCATGAMYTGDTVRTLRYTLAENPYYARAGAIIPMNPPTVGNLQQRCDTLVLTFIPGADGRLRHYEDDGTSRAYSTAYATTQVTKRQEGNTLRVRIEPREGTYEGASASRSWELRFPATFPPQKVLVDGREYPYARFPKAGQWTYDAYTLAPVVHVAEAPCDRALEVELVLDDHAVAHQSDLYGKSGVFKRCMDLTVEFKTEQGRFGETYLMLPKEYLSVSQCPNFILEAPQRIREFLAAYDRNRAALFEKTDAMTIIGPEFKERLRAQIGGLE
ncbi:TIM-barrel domain-containing protein [Alistipes sp.]|uniref:glycoside hydrolase family 31 protein n=1 Tax=Alistipes sp. TaxID=1872444 RepID=UPI003AEF1BA3